MIDLFEPRQSSGPCGSDLIFDHIQFCRRLGEQLPDGGNNVFRTHGGKVRKACFEKKGVVHEQIDRSHDDGSLKSLVSTSLSKKVSIRMRGLIW